MKDKNYESADLQWSMLLDLQSYLDNDRVHELLIMCRHKNSVVVKEYDEICHLVINECFDSFAL